MRRIHIVACLVIAILQIGISGCAEKTDKSLESIEINRKDGTAKVNDEFVLDVPVSKDYCKFVAIGGYKDNSTKDITNEVTWGTSGSKDNTGDAYILKEYPGIFFYRNAGVVAIYAKYTVKALDQKKNGEKATDITIRGDAIVRIK